MKILAHEILGFGSKTIIFLHELMGDSRNYETIIPYLDQKQFKFIFVDLRGYGKSKSMKGNFTCNEAATDIISLISHLNLKEVNLLAHSMSTMIAQKVALLDSRIKQLVLITPIPASGIKMSHNNKTKLLSQMSENKSKIEQIVESASKRYNQTWIDFRIKIAYDSSTLEARVGYMHMYLNTNFLNEVSKIQIPVKIIVGAHDFPVFSKANIEKLFIPSYKNLQIYQCEEAGHYPMIEAPVYFATKIESFCK